MDDGADSSRAAFDTAQTVSLGAVVYSKLVGLASISTNQFTSDITSMIPNIPDIWPIASVLDCPQITLRQWQIFEVQLPQKPHRTRHFVGYSVGDGAGQVSSAIQQFDPKSMRGVTESGRVYQLLGLPGWNADAEHTWRRWKSICSIASEVDVTSSIELTQENEQ